MSDKNVDNTSDVPALKNLTNYNAIDKILQFTSSLNELSPDVAKKAIEEIPEFVPKMLIVIGVLRDAFSNVSRQNAELTNNVLKQNAEITDSILKQNLEVTKNLNDACNKLLDSLGKMLLNENLKFEEKKWVIEKQVEIIGKMTEIDSANKKFMKETDSQNKDFVKKLDLENKKFWLDMTRAACSFFCAVTTVTKLFAENNKKKRKKTWPFG